MSDFSPLSLRVVLEVAAQRSFSAAAERLGYTQSAVSRQVAAAERAVGKPLFVRHSRGVTPTAAGAVLVRRAEEVLGLMEAARAEIDNLDHRVQVRLAIGGFSTSLAALLPRALGQLAVARPDLRVRLREGSSDSLMRGLATQRLHLAVMSESTPLAQGVHCEHLLDDPLLLLVGEGHRLAGLGAVQPRALTQEAWVAGSSDPRSTLLSFWNEIGPQQLQIAYVARDWTAKIGLVAAGLGVTLVPGLALASLPSAVRVLRIDHPLARRRIVVGLREQDGPAAARAVSDLTHALHVEAARLRVAAFDC